MNAFFIAVWLVLQTPGTPVTAQPNPFVAIEARAASALSAGAAGHISVFFRPKKGIHVNTVPAIGITIEKKSFAGVVGKISVSKDAHGYVDPAQPVVVALTPSPGTAKGRHTMKLKIVYFICSDAEGWCNRNEQSLDVPVTVK
jgi:hypothetical protein